MKNIFYTAVFIFTLFACHAIFAQSNYTQEMHSYGSSGRDAYNKGDLKAARNSYESALNIAQLHYLIKDEVLYLYNLAKIDISAGFADRAQARLSEIQKKIDKGVKAEDIVPASKLLSGEIMLATRDFKKASVIFKGMIDDKNIKDESLKNSVYLNYARALLEDGDMAGAKKIIEDLKKKNIGSPSMKGTIFYVDGLYFEKLGDRDNALAAFDKALDFDRMSGNSLKTAKSLVKLGEIKAASGEKDPAIEYFTRTLEILRYMREDRLQLKPLLALANISDSKSLKMKYLKEGRALAKKGNFADYLPAFEAEISKLESDSSK